MAFYLEEYREELRSDIDLNEYFSLPEIGDKKIEVIEIGLCSLTSCEILFINTDEKSKTIIKFCYDVRM